MLTPTTPTSRALGHEWLAETAENEISVGIERQRAERLTGEAHRTIGCRRGDHGDTRDEMSEDLFELRDVDGTHDDEITERRSRRRANERVSLVAAQVARVVPRCSTRPSAIETGDERAPRSRVARQRTYAADATERGRSRNAAITRPRACRLGSLRTSTAVATRPRFAARGPHRPRGATYRPEPRDMSRSAASKCRTAHRGPASPD